MRHFKYLVAMLSLAALASGDFGEPKGREIDEDKLREPVKKPVPRGCKEYQYGDFTCIASSEKVAKRKYNKWLNQQRSK